ncbi:hypothetical protein ACFVRR_11975 [Gottfriedia sp. NPDC057948]|uniref:hypothetical protein n=1 Tax=Gottfriedia sp. NPDC057948 TaxID=3346287 RepID=UPI0036D782E9
MINSIELIINSLMIGIEFVTTNKGLKIGSTTGYTNKMMDVVVPNAETKGYYPDFYITPDETNSFGRPYPYMIYRNMEALKLTAPWKVVKVGYNFGY